MAQLSILFKRFTRMRIDTFQRIGAGPVSRTAACRQRGLAERRSYQGRRVVESASPFLDENRTIEEKRIKHHLLRITAGLTDHKNWRNMVCPSNSSFRMVGRIRPEQIRDAGGESPYLRWRQSALAQSLDHPMGSSITS